MNAEEQEVRHPVLPGTTRAMWMVLAVVILADALDLMDATLTNIAAPTIERDLGGGEALIKWLGSAYALAMGVFLVIGGRLGDRYGQRRIFLIGIAGFTLSSLLCGLAPGPIVLTVGRFLQGGSGALMIPQGIAMITSSFSEDMKTKAFSVFGPALGLSSVMGPILGALIIGANIAGLSWRPMFLVNLLLGSIGFVVALKVLPEVPGDRTVVLDGVGSVLLALAMIGLMYGLISGSTNGWSAGPIALMGIGACALVGFGIRLRHARNPLILPSLFANRGFTTGLLMGLALFSVVSGLLYVIVLYFQFGLSKSPVQTAVTATLPVAIGIIVAAFVSAPLMKRLGRTLILAGLVITAVGTALLWVVIHLQGDDPATWTMLGPLLVAGIGMGTCFGTLFDIAVGDVTPEEAGSASGSLSAVQQLAAGIGAAVMTSVWFSSRAQGANDSVLACLAIAVFVALACCALEPLLPASAES